MDERSKIFADYFARYDIESSGVIKDPEEFTQLCHAVMYKMPDKMPAAKFEKAVSDAAEELLTEEVGMTLEEFE